MAALSIAISKTDGDNHNSIVEGKMSIAPSIKKTRSLDGRTFLTVLKQLLEQSGKKKEVDFGNEEIKEKAGLPQEAKKKIIDGKRLGSIKFEIKADEKKPDAKGKPRYSSGDKGRAPSRREVSDDSSNQPVLVANETVQLTSGFENKKEHDNTSLTRSAIDGKQGSNLTSIAPRVVVQDKRMELAKAGSTSRARRLGHYSGPVGEDVDREFRLENRPMRADMEIEIPRSFEGRDLPRSAAMKFARKLDGQVGNEIVRQIRIVLNRASAGELRIDLKPDNLGRVRVEIQLEDNHLSGRFFVETAAAREVFKGALDGLQAKLLESGFGTADLEMAWDDTSSNFRFNSGNSLDREIKNEAPEFENPTPVNAFVELDDNLVNLIV